MPVSTEDDWSDSDDEIGTGMETDVLLGVPDGRMETESDIKDATVSRIGGLPVGALSLVWCTNDVSMQILLYPPFQGVSAFTGTPIFVFPVQGLLGSYGASRAGVVPVRRQPYGPCAVCLGLRSFHLSETGWKVGKILVRKDHAFQTRKQHTSMAWFEV